MITLTYATEDGNINATFEDMDSMDKFLDHMHEREEKKLEIERKELEERNKRLEEAKLKEEEESKCKYAELKKGMTDLLLKAKEYGFDPRKMVDIITDSLSDLIDSNGVLV